LQRLLAVVLFGLLVAPAQLIPSATAADVSGLQLSTAGQQAFKDLSTCLASGKSQKLDVFYLVDSSGSLSYTDEQEVRATVLKNSIAQLSNFSEQGVDVSYAMALFSSDVLPLTDWTSLKKSRDFDQAQNLVDQAVNNNNVVGVTDWEQGLRYAHQELKTRPVANCKMLIWFTDGGINPVSIDDPKSTIDSLKRLCNTGISPSSLGGSSSRFGVFEAIRNDGISTFAVLYQNDRSSLEQFEANYEAGESEFDLTGADRLELEHYLMSFMVPLVEGSGQVLDSAVAKSVGYTVGGTLKCAELGPDGLAPAGLPNGAFLRAQDPVSLAFQFMKMQAVLAGGTGTPITDGKFEVPQGAVAFRLLTTSSSWKLSSPGDSAVQLTSKDTKSDPNASVSSSAGVTQIDYLVGADQTLRGTWKLDAAKGDSALFLFSGLTMVLDRDRTSQVVSERENTLTGSVVRLHGFDNLPVDLTVYDSKKLTLSTLDSAGKLQPVPNVSFTLNDNGQFKLEGYVPPAGKRTNDLWLTLELGGNFDPVTSHFSVDVVAKSDIATVKNSVIKLTDLVGPKGEATGSITVVGPTSVDSSTYCLDPKAIRTSDQQTGAQKHPRDDKFVWSFNGKVAGEAPICFEIAQGSQQEIRVSVTNPTQADSSVVSVRQTQSTSGAATLDENLQFEFKSSAESNFLIESLVIAALLALGLLLPLGLLYLLNWLTTRFLPVQNTVKAEFPVRIQPGPAGKITDDKGNAISVGPQDFKYVTETPASRVIPVASSGELVARLPKFPLAGTWFEHQAPEGSRVISLYPGATKKPQLFDAAKASEVSPNVANNWALVLPDSELLKPEGQELSARLVVFAPMGGVPQYQARVNEISSKPGLQQRIGLAREAVRNTEALPKKSKKPSKSANPVVAETGSMPSVQIPGVSNGSSMPASIPGLTPPTTPASTSIPGLQPPSVIPGSATPPVIPGVTPPPNIPGVTPPKN
jgi:hypothetical protein